MNLDVDLKMCQQLDARVHRQGQTETVFVHNLLCEDTLDEEIIEVQAGRKTMEEALIERIKEKL